MTGFNDETKKKNYETSVGMMLTSSRNSHLIGQKESRASMLSLDWLIEFRKPSACRYVRSAKT